ncbi:MAG: amidohydrolase family protein [Acidimicrobiia bacterium]|nr:amidohydrolase family protein [Acidimicrobiia bacterium]MDH3470570.1 amidohydrolase family protein [Acidimicrobiia bacterium]
MQRIDADRLIPGRGQPIDNATVIMDRGVITYAGPTNAAPDTPDLAAIQVPVVMPGMWDCHGHFFGTRTALVFEEAIATHPSVGVLRGLRDATAALNAGFVNIREPGGLGVHLAAAINEGTVEGPNIYSAHAVIGMTGGHSDAHSMPLDWAPHHESMVLADGVPEVLKAVRRQLRVNAQFIKICASGGVMSEVDHPIHQQFSDEELSAIVEEAARADRSVAAHCHGKPGIMAAVRAGVRTIEHGTYLDEEAATAMAETGTILVPTRFILEKLLTMKDEMHPYAFNKAVMVNEFHTAAVSAAIEAGVKIAVGTDIFMSGSMWGTNGLELKLLADMGLTPLAAIEAATANGPETLGAMAPNTGILEEGRDADVITVNADPLDNILVLANADNVTGVWKRGVQMKGGAA